MKKIIIESDAREQLEWNRKQNIERERRKGKVFIGRCGEVRKSSINRVNVSIKIERSKNTAKVFRPNWTDNVFVVNISSTGLLTPRSFFLISDERRKLYFFWLPAVIVRKLESIKSAQNFVSSLSLDSRRNQNYCIKVRRQLTSRNLSKSLDVSTHVDQRDLPKETLETNSRTSRPRQHCFGALLIFSWLITQSAFLPVTCVYKAFGREAKAVS